MEELSFRLGFLWLVISCRRQGYIYSWEKTEHNEICRLWERPAPNWERPAAKPNAFLTATICTINFTLEKLGAASSQTDIYIFGGGQFPIGSGPLPTSYVHIIYQSIPLINSILLLYLKVTF